MDQDLGPRIVGVTSFLLVVSAVGFVALAALDPSHRALGAAAAIDVLLAAALLRLRRRPSWWASVLWLGGAFLLAAAWAVSAKDEVWAQAQGLGDANNRLSLFLLLRAVVLGTAAVFFGRDDVQRRYPSR